MAKKEISLGNDFGDVTVTVNGVSVEINADGSIVAHSNGDKAALRLIRISKT